MIVAETPIELAKAELRTTVRGLLRAMTAGEREAESAAICDRAMSWGPLSEANCVMAYMPMAREVDVRPLIARLLERGTTVCLPRIDWENHGLSPVPIRDPDRDLGPAERGVRQPRADLAPIAASDVQIVVVPGLAFDAAGGRLGQGGGFYDRWLANQANHVRTIGAAYACQMVAQVPVTAHDRRLDAVATAETLHTTDRHG